MIGQTISQYEIIEKIGSGGMGDVYKARDTRLNRTVAIKFLRSEYVEDQIGKKRFLREARSAAALDHPFICKIFQVVEWEGSPYIAMEYVEGMSLKTRIEAGPIPPRVGIRLATEIAEALEKAHKNGIVHRDLKPVNVMITEEGHVKVLDFGLARRLEESGEDITTILTREGTVPGTPAYMAPEQIRAEKADYRADIFALGLIFYEIFTGTHPFRRPTSLATTMAILHDEMPPWGDRAAQAPAALEPVISRMLAKEPDHRYQTVTGVREALEEVAGRTLERSAPGRLPRWTWPGIAVLLLIGAMALFFQLSPGTGDSTEFQLSDQRLISTFAGSHHDASFSPDGSMIVFVSDASGIPQIWVKNLAQGDPIQITQGEAPASRPRWSPQNDQILFNRQVGGSRSLWSVPPLGGAPHLVLEDAQNASWSPDGSRIVFERTAQNNQGIWTANADGSQAQEVEGVPDASLLLCERRPSFSPDGTAIAFFHCPRGPLGDIWTLSLATGEARQLTFDEHFGGTPVWTPDGSHIIFSSLRRGSRTLWSVPVNGGEAESVSAGAGEDTDPELSPDGTRLVYTNTRNHFRIRLLDPNRNQSQVLHESRYDIYDPSFSPSGDKIAYFAITSRGDIQIFTLDLDGGKPYPLSRSSDEINIHPKWSFDGSHIFFYQARPDPSFRRIPAEGGSSIEIVPGWDRQRENGAHMDPSGRRLIYTKIISGVPQETLIRNLETGREEPFPVILRYPCWSRDGRQIVANSVGPRSAFLGPVVVCEVDSGSCRELAPWGSLVRWSYDESAVYFQTWKSPTWREIWVIGIDGSNPKKICDLQPLHPIGSFYSVSPDGEVVWVEFDRGRDELWLAELPISD